MLSANLNLVQKDPVVEKKKMVRSGIITAFSVVFFVIVAYGTVIFWKKNLDKEIERIQGEYKTENENFLSGNGNEIAEFGIRSIEAGKILKEDRSAAEVMSQIEKTVILGVYLEAVEYNREKGTLSLSCVADNFNSIAKQILSFKENEYFSSIVPGQAILDSEKNKLTFEMEASLSGKK